MRILRVDRVEVPETNQVLPGVFLEHVNKRRIDEGQEDREIVSAILGREGVGEMDTQACNDGLRRVTLPKDRQAELPCNELIDDRDIVTNYHGDPVSANWRKQNEARSMHLFVPTICNTLGLLQTYNLNGFFMHERNDTWDRVLGQMVTIPRANTQHIMRRLSDIGVKRLRDRLNVQVHPSESLLVPFECRCIPLVLLRSA